MLVRLGILCRIVWIDIIIFNDGINMKGALIGFADPSKEFSNMKMSTTTIHEDLRAKFPAAAIQWRAGDTKTENATVMARALPHLDPRDIQERLDAVVGPANWRTEYAVTQQGSVICTLSLNLNNLWISKQDGSGLNVAAADKARETKFVFSEAFCRAAVQWGIGRYLYACPEIYAPYSEDRKSFVDSPTIPDCLLSEAELAARAAAPAVAVEAPVPAPVSTPATPAVVAAAPAPAAVVATPTPAPAPAPAPVVESAPAAVAAPVTSAAPVVEAGAMVVTRGTENVEDELRAAGIEESELASVLSFRKKFSTVKQPIAKTFLEGSQARKTLSDRARAYLLAYVALGN